MVNGLTGHLLFVRAYMIGVFHTGTLPTDPPSAYAPVFTIESGSIALPGVTVELDWIAGSGANIAYWLTAPVPATWAFNTCRRPKLFGNFAGAPPVDVTATYLVLYGSLPVSGQAVYAVFREVTAVALGPILVARAVQP